MSRERRSVEELIRMLFPVRDLAEAERVTAEALGSASAGGRASLYAREGDEYVLRASFPAEEEGVPPRLPASWVHSLPGAPGEPVPASRVPDPPDGLPTDVAALARLEGEGGAGYLCLIRSPPEGGIPGDGGGGRLGLLLDCGAAALRNAELFDRLRSQAYLDYLTGCYNRRAFEEHLRTELVRSRRYHRPLSLLLLDLDHFKRINDGQGHVAGDHALQRVGAALLDAFRTTDRVCRYGGDEFAVIFPETSKEDVVRLAERLRVEVEALFPDDIVTQAITSSLGVAAYPGDAGEPEDLLQAADRALYAAKSRGRNQVVAAPA